MDEKPTKPSSLVKADDTQVHPRKGFWARKEKNSGNDATEDRVEVTQTEDKVPPVSFLRLFRFATKLEVVLNVVGIICAFAAGAAHPLMTLLFGDLTQAFVNFGLALQETPEDLGPAAEHFRTVAARTAGWLALLGLGMGVAVAIYLSTWTYTGETQSKRIRERYLAAVLRQDIAYFDRVGAGEVTTRIQTDCHLVQTGMSEKVALCASHTGSFLCGFILAYVQSWKLSLAVSCIFPCLAITGTIWSILEQKWQKKTLDQIARGGSLAEEVISTVRTTQAFGAQQKLAALYNQYIISATKYTMKQCIMLAGGTSVFYFVVYAAYGLAFHFGTTLLLKDQITVGEIINVFAAILIGSFSISLITPELQAINHARSAAAKLFATIDRVPTIDSADPGGKKPDAVLGHITFDNVKFTYPSRPDVPILKGLTVAFEAGKTAALVGASGSGKSTVVQLVERFYDVSSGSVSLDGVDIRELNVKWLRSQIGLVSQEPVLFATTIAGNVAHGLIGTPWENANKETKEQLIREACVKANADSFIQHLPNGYETVVGERGFLLSGGQKQRIAIARAIVSDPKILLLDEATSALDTQSEGIVQNALDKAAAGRTTITIAHRLSTIKNAHQIFVVGTGEILEQGTHDELMSQQGSYSRLVEAQKLRDSDSDGTTTPGDIEIEDISAEEVGAASKADALARTSTGASITSAKMQLREADRDAQKRASYTVYGLFKRMGSINKAQWKRYTYATVASIIAGAVHPAFGIVYGYTVNGYAQTDRAAIRREGDRNALWFFVIAVGATTAVAFQNYGFATAAATLTGRLRQLSFKSLLRHDIQFFDRDENSTGMLTSSLSEDPQKVNGLAGITLGTIIQSISTVCIGIIVGVAYGWKLALVAVACIPFVVVSGYIQLRVVVMKDQVNKELHEHSAQVACEAAASIRTVASLVREEDCTRAFGESLDEALRRSNRSMVPRVAMFALSQAASFWVISLIFWYGSRLVASLEYNITSFFVVLMGTTFSAIEAGNVFIWAPDMSAAKGSATTLIKLLDDKPDVDAESTEGTVLKQVDGRIVFEDVHFRYPTRPGVRVLRGLNLTIEPGTFVALVGASGCGKSTVIQLTERFYDPIAGRVSIDGTDVSELNVQEYRKNIALVSQEPTLYSGTIKFNILLGAVKPHDEVAQEEIEQACRDANILEFIQSLPDGFETDVGSKGSALSGGQKQRIAIARALIRNPKVLLLDEATSALDSSSERVVQEALDKAAKGRTTIAIAHRLSTIQNADCIYFVKDGRVVEAGTHGQLISRGGEYASYVQLQILGRSED